jgi:hypothetical protein
MNQDPSVKSVVSVLGAEDNSHSGVDNVVVPSIVCTSGHWGKLELEFDVSQDNSSVTLQWQAQVRPLTGCHG